MVETLSYVHKHGHQLLFSAKLISYLLQRLGLAITGIEDSAEGFEDVIIGLLVVIFPGFVYFYMLYLMRLHQNFQYLRQRSELVVFGGALTAFNVATVISMASIRPTVRAWSRCLHTQIAETDVVVDICDGTTDYLPLYSCNFGIEYMLFFLIILFFKQSEDYIANYSQAHNHKIVSIYQRRIIDDVGNIDGGLRAEIKEIVKTNRSTLASSTRGSNAMSTVRALNSERDSNTETSNSTQSKLAANSGSIGSNSSYMDSGKNSLENPGYQSLLDKGSKQDSQLAAYFSKKLNLENGNTKHSSNELTVKKSFGLPEDSR